MRSQTLTLCFLAPLLPSLAAALAGTVEALHARNQILYDGLDPDVRLARRSLPALLNGAKALHEKAASYYGNNIAAGGIDPKTGMPRHAA